MSSPSGSRNLRRPRRRNLQRPRRNRARGLALISVLWLIMLLTLLATAAATVTVTERRSAARSVEATQLDALADSAIRVVLLRLIAPLPRAPAAEIGVTSTVQLPGGNATVTLELEAIRVDLNAAGDEQLLAAFTTRGWRADAARSMVARLADWKDADDAARPGGAELREYRQHGLLYGPRNGPFESVNELRQVIGGEALDSTLLEGFTVYTHRAAPIDPSAAVTPGEQRSFSGEVVRIRSCAQVERGDRCRVAIVRLTGSVRIPIQVFVWATQN